MTLDNLWEQGLKGVLAVYDLREICEGRGDKIDQNTVRDLVKLGLVQPDGRVHSSIKNVVVSSLEGESVNTALVSPIARSNTKPSGPKSEHNAG
jgi:hypothetical protein